MFRHSVISELYANNVSLDLISDLVEHSGTSITKQVYLHQTDEKKHMLKVLKFMKLIKKLLVK